MRRVRLRRGLLRRRAGEAEAPAAAAVAAAGGETTWSLSEALLVPFSMAVELVERRALAEALRLAGSTMVNRHELCLKK